MHSGQERMHSLNIEFIHINACMGYIQDIFIEALMSHPQLQWRRKIALLRAINKVMMIQLDLFAKWRVRDGEEFAEEMSTHSFGSREGYVGDKKVLGSDGCSLDEDQASIAESVARSASVDTMHSAQSTTTINRATSQRSACPFASLGKGAGTETKIWAN